MCGYTQDRDVNSAENIEQEGVTHLFLNLDPNNDYLGAECSLSYACGDLSARLTQRMLEVYSKIPRVSVRQVVEAGSSLRSGG